MTTIDERAFGTLERHGASSVLRYSRRLAHAPEAVFRAITEDDALAAWFPTTIEGERRAGAPLTLRFRGGEAPPMSGTLLAIEEPRLLELEWGPDRLRIDLAPYGGGCVLTLTVTFDEHAKAARDGAGWHVCLDRLAAQLGGETADGDPSARWRALAPHYVTRFGPAASVSDPPQGWQDEHGAVSMSDFAS